jgi:hypothetical protein
MTLLLAGHQGVVGSAASQGSVTPSQLSQLLPVHAGLSFLRNAVIVHLKRLKLSPSLKNSLKIKINTLQDNLWGSD